MLNTVITVHNEGEICLSTIASVARAYNHASMHLANIPSLSITCIADNADSPTLDSLQKAAKAYNGLQILETNFGDPGKARNTGISFVHSELTFVIDGDDLISDNFFLAYLLTEDSQRESTIFHPEYLFTFGKKMLVWRQPERRQIDNFSSLVLAANPYDTCSIGRTHLYLQVPYAEARQVLGYGYEDWHFVLESQVCKINHDIVPGAVKYTRLKHSSRLSADRLNCSLLPYSMWLDRISSKR